MPGFDNTGPMGNGPMTGVGRGRCRGAEVVYGRQFPGNRGINRRIRPGCGYGRGGWDSPERVPYSITAGQGIERLKAEAAFIKKDLDLINKQIADLEKSQPKE